MLELNKIYQMDALTLLRQMPDKSVSLIVTDPPYGVNIPIESIGGSKNADATKFVKVDKWDMEIPSKEVFDEMFRISDKVIIFGGNYFTEHLKPSSCWYIWDKRCNITPERSYADCELIWTNLDKPSRLIRFLWDGFIQDNSNKIKDVRMHPTQKPVEIIRRLIKDNTDENDLVLDCFMGSGTTAVACKHLNRKFIGCDINKEYCDIANKRLQQENLLTILEKSNNGS